MNDKEKLSLAKKLLASLLVEPVTSFGGGSVYGKVDGKHSFLMTTTEMYHAVQMLARADIRVERIDAGGSPTWGLRA
jgi:hypothetical protein